MKDQKVQIVLYRWAGRKLFFRIGSECEECDDSVQCIRELLEREFRGVPIDFKIRNWLDHLGEALWHGGWHPPVIVVNGRRFSQGVAPGQDALAERIRSILAQNPPRCPICRRSLMDEDYAAHRKSETRSRVLRFIEAQHPEWVSQDGVCARCLAAYQRRLDSGQLAG